MIKTALNWRSAVRLQGLTFVLFGLYACDQHRETDLVETYEFYNITDLPHDLGHQHDIAKPLSILQRERCDWDALYDLVEGVYRAGYKREAATALVAYSHKCSEASGGLYWAAEIFYELVDYPAALEVADELLEIDATNGDFHFLRGQIQAESGQYKAAIDSYTSVLELEDDLNDLSSAVFEFLSDIYAEAGNYCEAITPIITWIALDPQYNDTRSVRTLITDYAERGDCSEHYADGEDHFPITDAGVISAIVEVNGVEGNFIVDTGASNVSITHDFAGRAGVLLGDDYNVPVRTANGLVHEQSVTLDEVQLGHTHARNVAGLVEKPNSDGLGAGIDGLLGRSFLSRFNVTFGDRAWTIKSRSLTQNEGEQ